MTFNFVRSHSRRVASGGFTLLEILLVVAIIGLLVVVAVPLYQSYVARSRAAELALKFDAVRTNIQVAAKSGDVQTACANLASTVQSGNLQSTYAQLALNFEPVTGGFTPVLTMCATIASQGQRGVEVTREAHHLLSRDSVISQGAVIGDSAVSFSVKLAGDAALCTTQPPAGAAKTGCAPGTSSVAQSAGTANTPVTPASGAASQPVVSPVVVATTSPGSFSTLATGAGAVVQQGQSSQVNQAGQTGPKICPSGPAQQVGRSTMRLGSGGTGAITNNVGIDTNGNMPAITAEIVIAGDVANAPGATLMSYTTPRSGTGISLWNPQSLHITLAGTQYNTGVNVNDQQSHRLTMSWRQTGGTLVLYDNGREVWRQLDVNRGGTVGGNGRLVIGQDARPVSGGGLMFRDGYQGSIVAASLATRAVSAAQAGMGPLANVLQPGNGLITNVIMGPNGQPIDTTGRTSFTMTGDANAHNAMVSTAVYVDNNCK